MAQESWLKLMVDWVVAKNPVAEEPFYIKLEWKRDFSVWQIFMLQIACNTTETGWCRCHCINSLASSEPWLKYNRQIWREEFVRRIRAILKNRGISSTKNGILSQRRWWRICTNSLLGTLMQLFKLREATRNINNVEQLLEM